MKKLLMFLLLSFSTFSFCSERQPYLGRADLSAPDEISEEAEIALANLARQVYESNHPSIAPAAAAATAQEEIIIDPQKFTEAITFTKLPSGARKCNLCGTIVGDKRNVSRHRKTHTERHTCQKCGKSFGRKSYLTVHEKDCGNKIARFKCAVCNEPFKNKSTLKLHENLHSSNPEIYTCPHEDCGQTYNHPHKLESHIQTAHSPRNYRCNICSKLFTHISNVRAHIARTHGIDKEDINKKGLVTNIKKQKELQRNQKRDTQYYKEHVIEDLEEILESEDEDAMKIDNPPSGGIASAHPDDYSDDDEDDEEPFLEMFDPL